MTILSIDTAGAAAGVALVEDGHVVASLYVRQALRTSRPALRAVDTLLSWTQRDLASLRGIVVNVGPGAFTGVRVGLALAQGLALASGKPLVGGNAFEALVALVPQWHGMICPVLEARKGEVYAALYRQQQGIWQQTVPGMVIAPRALCAYITEPTLLLGSGVRVYGTTLAATLGKQAILQDTGVEESGLMIGLARLGLARLQEEPPAPPAILQPLYIRPADARLPRHVAEAVEVV